MTQQALKVLGTLLLLWGIFGFLFPQWGNVQFTNNENLFHILIGLLAILMAEFSPFTRRWSLLLLAVIFLTLGIYSFTLETPTDFQVWRVAAQADLVDNVIHTLFGLGFAWFWLQSRPKA